MAMAKAEDCRSTQLIDDMGEFKVHGLNSFIQSVKLEERGVSYAVVAIMGPQSSGKSTLLNNLFRTNFVEMDALEGRSQTTKGIWMAKAVDVEPLTIVLDIEGNDGDARGEDQKFEKQTALFALAVADVVLINMWCNDVGRDAGAGKPLLRTVFQVMAKLFTPRKTMLLFVIRDKTETPLDKLKMSLINSTEKIWREVTKSEAHKNAPLSDFFTVEVTALPSYRDKQEFKKEVAQLEKWFHNSIAPGGLAGDRQGVVEASGFSFSAKKMWKDIRKNKDLDLPNLKVMVANLRCDEIARDMSGSFYAYKHWLELDAAAKSGPVSSFGKQLSLILETFLSKYDKKTKFFDEGVRDAKRKTLESNLLQLARPAYETLLGHLLSHATERFETQLDEALRRGKGFIASVRECSNSCLLEFDKRCADASIQQATDWSTISNTVRHKLIHIIEEHSSSVRDIKLSEIVARCEKILSDRNIEKDTQSYLELGKNHSWPSIRMLLREEIDGVTVKFGDYISEFELEESIRKDMLQRLKDYGTSIVEMTARETAKRVVLYMKDRFSNAFCLDQNYKPRRWNGDEDIKEIIFNAIRECLELLSVMAAIRLHKQPADDIESILLSSFLPDISGVGYSDGNLLASHSWDKVSPIHTIITPVECISIWNHFKPVIVNTVNQTVAILERSAPAPAPAAAPHAGGGTAVATQVIDIGTAIASLITAVLNMI